METSFKCFTANFNVCARFSEIFPIDEKTIKKMTIVKPISTFAASLKI